MMAALRRLIETWLPPRSPARPAANRLTVTEAPEAIYAIGDIHGCLDLLVELEAQIAADAADARAERWLVTLGDVVDRGPASAQVIDHLRRPAPAGLRRINLMGNHEAMMLDFLHRPRAGSMWLENGGTETLASYGVPMDKLMRLDNRSAQQIVDSYIPSEHFDYLAALPVLLDTPAALFVHAGLRPGTGVAQQSDEDLLWFRDEFRSDFAEFGRPVVHGHTMREAPLVTPFRIAIDTAAVVSGHLTAVRIDGVEPPRLFSTLGRPATRLYQ
jgi:serine/threonine protein phosphatase 1